MPDNIGENFQKIFTSSLFGIYFEQDELEITVPIWNILVILALFLNTVLTLT